MIPQDLTSLFFHCRNLFLRKAKSHIYQLDLILINFFELFLKLLLSESVIIAKLEGLV